MTTQSFQLALALTDLSIGFSVGMGISTIRVSRIMSSPRSQSARNQITASSTLSDDEDVCDDEIDDEVDSEEEEPATQKGQDSDGVRANCAFQELAVPAAMGDEALAKERFVFRETSTCGSPDSLPKKSIAHSNGFRRETVAPTSMEESAIEIMRGLRSSFQALCHTQFLNMSINPFESATG